MFTHATLSNKSLCENFEVLRRFAGGKPFIVCFRDYIFSIPMFCHELASHAYINHGSFTSLPLGVTFCLIDRQRHLPLLRALINVLETTLFGSFNMINWTTREKLLVFCLIEIFALEMALLLSVSYFHNVIEIW